jgi:hypothetical protein
MGATTLVQLRCVSLDPAPNATGIHGKTSFPQQLGHMLISQGYRKYQRTAVRITSPGYWRPLNGLVALIGTALTLPICSLKFRNKTVLCARPTFLSHLQIGVAEEDKQPRPKPSVAGRHQLLTVSRPGMGSATHEEQETARFESSEPFWCRRHRPFATVPMSDPRLPK